MPAGKMRLVHERSQSGGYHYFLEPVARLLQRFVRRSRARNNARGNASAHGTEDPTSTRRRAGAGSATAGGSTARRATERFPRDPWALVHSTQAMSVSQNNSGPARVRIV